MSVFVFKMRNPHHILYYSKILYWWKF